MTAKDRPPNPALRETLDYIAGITAPMVDMARQHKLATLAYLLDMARLEAGTQANDLGKADDQPVSGKQTAN